MVSTPSATVRHQITHVDTTCVVLWRDLDWDASTLAERSIRSRVSRPRCVLRVVDQRACLCYWQLLCVEWDHGELFVVDSGLNFMVSHGRWFQNTFRH